MQTVSPRSNQNRINIGTSFRNGNDKDRGPAGKILPVSSSFLVGTDCWHDSFASLKQNSANKDFGDWSSVNFEDDCFSVSDNSSNKNEKPTNNKSETIVTTNLPTTTSTSTSTSTTTNEERRKKGKQNDSQLLRRASNSSSRRKKETKKGSSSKTKTNSEDTDVSAAAVVPPLPPADIRNRRSRFQQAGHHQQPPQNSTRSLKSIARRNSIPNKNESDSSSLEKRTSSKDSNTHRHQHRSSSRSSKRGSSVDKDNSKHRGAAGRQTTISSSSSHRQKEEDGESSSLEEENSKEKSTHRRHRSSRNSRRGSSLVKNVTVVELSPKRSFSVGSNEHNDTIDELHRLLHRRRRKPKGSINSEESSKRTGKQIADVVKASPLTKSNAEEVKSDHARPPSTVAYEGDTPTLPTRSQSMGSNSARHPHHHDAVPRRSGRKGSSHRGSTYSGSRDRAPDRVDSNEHRERRQTSRRRNGATAAKKNSDHVETEMRDFLEHMSW